MLYLLKLAVAEGRLAVLALKFAGVVLLGAMLWERNEVGGQVSGALFVVLDMLVMWIGEELTPWYLISVAASSRTSRLSLTSRALLSMGLATAPTAAKRTRPMEAREMSCIVIVWSWWFWFEVGRVWAAVLM